MMSPTRERLAQNVQANIEHFNEIISAIDSGASYDENGYPHDPHDALFETPLDVRVERTLSVLLTCGCPHIEVVSDMEEDGSLRNACIVGHWGDERVERHLDMNDPAFRALMSYAEGVSAA